MFIYFIAGCLIVVLVIFKVWKKQYLFILTISDGKPQVTYGKVSIEFIEDVQRICKLFSVQNGTIKGVQGRKGINLICDGPIKAQQHAIKNAMDHPL